MRQRNSRAKTFASLKKSGLLTKDSLTAIAYMVAGLFNDGKLQVLIPKYRYNFCKAKMTVDKKCSFIFLYQCANYHLEGLILSSGTISRMSN